MLEMTQQLQPGEPREREMRVAVEARFLCAPFSSMTLFSGNLLSALSRMDLGARPVALIPQQLDPSAFRLREELSDTVLWLRPKRNSYRRESFLDELRWISWDVPKLLRSDVPDVDLVLMSYHHSPVLAPAAKRVSFVHDLCGLGLGFPKTKKNFWRHYIRLRTAVHFADTIVPVSHSTRNEMANRFKPSRRRLGPVVHNAVDRKPADDEVVASVIASYGLRRRGYVIAFATRQLRKNFACSLASLTELRQRGRHLRLVGVAPVNEFEEVRTWCAEAGLNDALIVSGVSESDLDALYAGSLALIWPSTCEGFGYPVVEAMRQGCPPIVWSVGPGAELVGAAFDPISSLGPKAIADKLEMLMDQDADACRDLQRSLRLRSKAFSTDMYEERLRELFLLVTRAE